MAHPKRKDSETATSRRGTHHHSRVTTIRLPYYLEDALKAEAEVQGKPWQTLLKDLLKETLGLSGTEEAYETEMRSATELHRAMRKLKIK